MSWKERKKKIFFVCQNLICEVFGPYYMGFIFYFEKQLTYKKTELNVLLRKAMGNISNFYKFSSTFFIFLHAYSSYNMYTCCKVSLMSLTYFSSYDFLFLEIRTQAIFKISLLSQTFITVSQIHLEKGLQSIFQKYILKRKIFFVCQNLICEISGLYCTGFIFILKNS